MDLKTLKRGARKVIFKMVPAHFEMCLKQGPVTDLAALAAAASRPNSEATYHARRVSQLMKARSVERLVSSYELERAEVKDDARVIRVISR